MELTIAVEGGELVLRVRDRGPGIAPGEWETVFERFRRGERQRDGSIAGVGLGLYLARRILRAHDGDLVAAETTSPGACFVLTLPFTPDPSST